MSEPPGRRTPPPPAPDRPPRDADEAGDEPLEPVVGEPADDGEGEDDLGPGGEPA